MSATPEMAKMVMARGAAAGPLAKPGRGDSPALARRLAIQLNREWFPRLAWWVSRTGRAGLVGIALLLAAALFLVSTHLKIAAEVEGLRADLAAAQGPARTATADKVDPAATAMRALPARTDIPAILRQLFNEAAHSHLAIDTGKYEIKETKTSGVVRYQIAFPVTGPYPHIRSFIDATLSRMPAVALNDLVFERKSIADGDVEAQLRMTVYTVETGPSGPARTEPTAAGPRRQAPPGAAATGDELAGAPAQPRAAARAPEGHPASDRVVAPTHATALFAQHSWVVLKPVKLPPPAPPAPEPPPPPPQAPPLPYTFVGSFTPEGDRPVFFLSQRDRMISAHVGDQLDGVYQIESAGGGQLVFVYLPLNIRQVLAAGASK